MAIERVEVQWSLGVGGSGLTVMYALDGSQLAADLEDFFLAIASRIPASVTLSCAGSGDVIDEATGTLSGTWSDGTGWLHPGTGTGNFAAGVGASVRWTTAGIHAGHRVSGRTYLVPLNNFCYGSDGTLDAPALADLRTASSALVSATVGNLVIWSRPSTSSPGGASPVIAANVADAVSTLRTRRT